MPIDWQALTNGPLPLDYYAVTVRDGAIVAQKVYYRTDAAPTGLPPFDGLCAAGLLRPFSFGTDDAGNKKYDFALTREFRAVCHAVARQYPFFDAERVIALDSLMQRSGAAQGKIVGMKVQDKTVKSVCLYLRTALPCTDERADDAAQLAAAFARVQAPSCPPPSGKDVQLYLVALDFAQTAFKLKLYYKFLERSAPAQLVPLLAHSGCADLAARLLQAGGFLEGFQIALSEEGESFNFYLKPPDA